MDNSPIKSLVKEAIVCNLQKEQLNENPNQKYEGQDNPDILDAVVLNYLDRKRDLLRIRIHSLYGRKTDPDGWFFFRGPNPLKLAVLENAEKLFQDGGWTDKNIGNYYYSETVYEESLVSPTFSWLSKTLDRNSSTTDGIILDIKEFIKELNKYRPNDKIDQQFDYSTFKSFKK